MTLLDGVLVAVPVASAVGVAWRFGVDWVERFLLGSLAFVCVGLLSCVIGAVVDEAYAEKFSLRKDSWNCTRSHEETTSSTFFMKVNGVSVPITTTGTEMVCDQWSKKKS